MSYKNCITVDSVGRNGGLALLWKEEVKIQARAIFQWSQRRPIFFKFTDML